MKYALIALISAYLLAAQDHEHMHDMSKMANTPVPAASSSITIPDVALVNQKGEHVRFYSDLVKGRAVAIQTIFTTCTTICPPMGATWGRLQTLMQGADASSYQLISISIDPQVDTPQRLAEWGAKFHAGPNWTLLTGSQTEIDKLLKALKLYTPDKNSHTPLAMLGSDAGWQYVDVLKSQAPMLSETLKKAVAPRQTTDDNPDLKYFTDVLLTDQTGKQVRLYSDVMKGRILVIDEFFTSCKDSCPMMADKFARLQEYLGPRLGKDVFLVSISVDPETDTPDKLRAYAQRFKAKPGWIFLTGTKPNVEFALGKLGPKANSRDDHTTLFLMGNMNTHLWKKAKGTASVEALAPVLQSVLDDKS